MDKEQNKLVYELERNWLISKLRETDDATEQVIIKRLLDLIEY